MDIDALRTFIEVSRTRHFGQAARNLYVSQSTVSARIKLLEQQVGVPLFVRQRNNIQLTVAGEKLLHYAESMVTTWTRARQEIAIDDESLVPFIVGSTPSLWDSVLQDWMKFIISQKPDMVLNVEVHDSEVLARRIQDLTMDIAFVFDNPQLLELQCKEVTEIPFIMVSTKNNISAEQAIKEDYILVEWGASFSVAHARFFPNMSQPRMRVMLGRIALNYILANGGHAYMPEPMVSELLDNQELFQVKDAPVIKRSVFALFSTDNKNPEMIKTACDFFN
ncbi:MAG: LysR family transcriptional regulator [Thioalkalispiraceae bacterium]|jgi:DNA-binding transcriptional LysR family regulator